MKKVLFLFIISLFTLSSCSKDSQSFNKERILGCWVETSRYTDNVLFYWEFDSKGNEIEYASSGWVDGNGASFSNGTLCLPSKYSWEELIVCDYELNDGRLTIGFTSYDIDFVDNDTFCLYTHTGEKDSEFKRVKSFTSK